MTRHSFCKSTACPTCGGKKYYEKSGKCKGCIDRQRRESIQANQNFFRRSSGSPRLDEEKIAQIMHGVSYEREYHTNRQ